MTERSASAQSAISDIPVASSAAGRACQPGPADPTDLILHYQMDLLVSGAFRLMANLVTPG